MVLEKMCLQTVLNYIFFNKIMKSQFPCNMHIYTLYLKYTNRVLEISCSGLNGVVLTTCSFLCLKRPKLTESWNQNFLSICTFTQFVLNTNKV